MKEKLEDTKTDYVKVNNKKAEKPHEMVSLDGTCYEEYIFSLYKLDSSHGQIGVYYLISLEYGSGQTAREPRRHGTS